MGLLPVLTGGYFSPDTPISNQLIRHRRVSSVSMKWLLFEIELSIATTEQVFVLKLLCPLSICSKKRV